MSSSRILQWFVLAATACMLMLLKWLHLGGTHYNLFLTILLGWVLGVILLFHRLKRADRSRREGREIRPQGNGTGK